MPHCKAGPLGIGAIVVAVLSTSILVGAMALVPSPPIEVVSDSQAVVMASAAPRTVVTGRILDAEGSPVAGSAVRVRSDARPGWDWVTSSGSDGSFRVEGVAAGKLYVAAQDVEAGFVESPLLDENEARHVVLVLDRMVELAGVVLDERGAPVARAAVKCAGKPGAPDRVVIADGDGRFILRGAARSIDHLTVWAHGFEATMIAVAPAASGVMKCNVRLRPARALRGLVVDPSGDPVAGARVSACPGKEAEVATSDVAGVFELPASVIGCWIAAYHPRFAGARSQRIADRHEIVLRLGAGGAIEGTAVDQHGKPIGLFSVTIASFEPADEAPGTPTRAGETGEHLRGTFRLDDLAPGTYVLQLGAEGMIDTQSKPIEVGRGRVMRGERIVLSAAEIADSSESADEPAPAQREEATETAESGSEESTKVE